MKHIGEALAIGFDLAFIFAMCSGPCSPGGKQSSVVSDVPECTQGVGEMTWYHIAIGVYIGGAIFYGFEEWNSSYWKHRDRSGRILAAVYLAVLWPILIPWMRK